MPNKLIDVKEAAEMLGLSVRTLYKYAEDGKIPHVKYGDTRRAPIRFDERDLTRFMGQFRRESV